MKRLIHIFILQIIVFTLAHSVAFSETRNTEPAKKEYPVSIFVGGIGLGNKRVEKIIIEKDNVIIGHFIEGKFTEKKRIPDKGKALRTILEKIDQNLLKGRVTYSPNTPIRDGGFIRINTQLGDITFNNIFGDDGRILYPESSPSSLKQFSDFIKAINTLRKEKE